MAPHCTEPFIIILSSSGYDISSVERDIKLQTIILSLQQRPWWTVWLCNLRFAVHLCVWWAPYCLAGIAPNKAIFSNKIIDTPEPLYNTIVGVHSITVLVKQPCYIQTKMYRLYWKMTIYGPFYNIIYTFLGSIFEPCYIQNCVIKNHVIKHHVIKRL